MGARVSEQGVSTPEQLPSCIERSRVLIPFSIKLGTMLVKSPSVVAEAQVARRA